VEDVGRMHVFHCAQNLVQEKFEVIFGKLVMLLINDPLQVCVEQLGYDVAKKNPYENFFLHVIETLS
jgi:hypothetical protein